MAKMNRPARIDGSAVIASTIVRTSRPARLRVSLRNTAQASPSGTVITSAIAMMISVPTIAWRMPPSSAGRAGPAALMSSV